MAEVRGEHEVTSLGDSVVRYGVWERKADGSLRSVRENYGSVKIAQQTADEYNAEEAAEQVNRERFAKVTNQPVRQPDHYFVVKATTTFEEVS